MVKNIAPKKLAEAERIKLRRSTSGGGRGTKPWDVADISGSFVVAVSAGEEGGAVSRSVPAFMNVETAFRDCDARHPITAAFNFVLKIMHDA